METAVPASFIPHDTPAASGGYRERSAGLPELALLISIILLVASSALAGGVFLYAQYLATASSSKVQQLDRAKAAFDPALIQKIMRLNDRLHAADALIGTHLAPTLFFDALQAATLSTVSFADLDLQADSAGMTIKMSGVAQSVNSIALQADLFSKNGVIKDPIFSGIDREQDGVHFALTAEVDPKAVGYGQLLRALAPQAAGAASAVPVEQPAQEPSPFGNLPANR